MHFEYFLISTTIPLFLEHIHVPIPKKQLVVVCAEVSGANESGLTLCPFVWISGQTLEVILNPYAPSPTTAHPAHTWLPRGRSLRPEKQLLHVRIGLRLRGAEQGNQNVYEKNNPAPDGSLLQYQRQITCSSHAAADTADQ